MAADVKDGPQEGSTTPAAGMLVDPAVLQEMLLFFVHLALHAGRGWDAQLDPPGQVIPDNS